MGEYVKYKGREVKIGTCENLYYTTYQQFVAAIAKHCYLSSLPDNDLISNYAMPNSGYRFRFPFPDEKHIDIGGYDDFDRGLLVRLDCALFPGYTASKDGVHGLFEIEITQQKLIHRESDGQLCLALVWRNPKDKESFRVEDDQEMKLIIRQILKHHVLNNPDVSSKEFYRQIAANILKGYRLKFEGVSQIWSENKSIEVGKKKSLLNRRKGRKI